jgi:glyoxylase-like metal-dependent hydrolase (beta-lactamase superfamily II)
VGAILLRANNASPWTGPTGTNTYLFRGAPSALVDAGVGSDVHLARLVNALGEEPLHAVLLTHDHADHSGGIPAIQGKWPDVRIERFGQVSGETIAAGDTVLRPIHTPGHAPDHLCFFDEHAGDLYCGDLVRLGGTIVIPASKGGNLRLYLDSLARIRELSPRRLLPGHGPTIDDPRAVIAEYLSHRAEREAQVIAALAAGDMTPEQITARVYSQLPPGLAAAAADSVLAHLVKLHDEQRAFVSDDGWRLA